MNSPLRWLVRLLGVVVAVALIWPAAHKLMSADELMPLPSATWSKPVTQVSARAASAPSPTEPLTVHLPELDVVLGFRDTGASNGWLDVGSSITSGVHFANGSTLTRGSYLVAAHVNSRDLSLSPFAKLWQVEPGMLVWVTDAENVAHRFVVVALGAYDKQALPADVFDPDRASQLVLVTCGGRITEMPNGTRQYAQNVVVRAVPFD